MYVSTKGTIREVAHYSGTMPRYSWRGSVASLFLLRYCFGESEVSVSSFSPFSSLLVSLLSRFIPDVRDLESSFSPCVLLMPTRPHHTYRVVRLEATRYVIEASHTSIHPSIWQQRFTNGIPGCGPPPLGFPTLRVLVTSSRYFIYPRQLSWTSLHQEPRN